jgi:3-deoxy-D-manno-octulosonic acid kinase
MLKRWPTGAEVRLKSIHGGAMLYDASRLSNADEGWFEPKWWQRRGTITPGAEGRGGTLFIDANPRHFVLRQYRRGGWPARFSKERYFWRGVDHTRSFAEWYLLHGLSRAGLPAPIPIAACYHRRGPTYTAALLTQQIEGVRSLAALLAEAPLALPAWTAIGRCLRRFHDAGVYHADLNAHNVLLTGAHEVWLVDFDRGELRRPGFWCDANLVRLRRSIEKITDADAGAYFTEEDWASLLSGYFTPPEPAE